MPKYTDQTTSTKYPATTRPDGSRAAAPARQQLGNKKTNNVWFAVSDGTSASRASAPGEPGGPSGGERSPRPRAGSALLGGRNGAAHHTKLLSRPPERMGTDAKQCPDWPARKGITPNRCAKALLFYFLVQTLETCAAVSPGKEAGPRGGGVQVPGWDRAALNHWSHQRDKSLDPKAQQLLQPALPPPAAPLLPWAFLYTGPSSTAVPPTLSKFFWPLHCPPTAPGTDLHPPTPARLASDFLL